MAPVRGLWLAILLAVAARGGATAQVLSPMPADAQPVVDLPFQTSRHNVRLSIFRQDAPDGGPRYYVLPPFVQARPVEASGSGIGAVHYALVIEAALPEKLAAIVQTTTEGGRVEATIVDFLTVAVPELNFVRTIRGQQLPPIRPGTRLTLPVEVDASLIKLAYERLLAGALELRLTFSFGRRRPEQASLVLNREEFLTALPVFGQLAERAAYRQTDIEDHFGAMKRDSFEFNQWSAFQLVPLHQLSLADLLTEWFDEVPPDLLGGSRRPEQSPAQQKINPFQGLPRPSEERLFAAKTTPTTSSLEAMRFSFVRPVQEVVQSLRLGFQVPPVPRTFAWQEVITLPRVDIACGEQGKRLLPVTLRPFQLIEIRNHSGTLRPEHGVIEVQVGSERREVVPQAKEGMGRADVQRAVVTSGGRPALAYSSSVCSRLSGRARFEVAVYE